MYNEMENNWHVFLECPCSVACWRRIGIYDILQTVTASVDSFAKLFFKVRQVTDGDKLINFSMLLWSLWKRRNTKLWEGKLEDFKQVMARASEVLNSWLFARNS